jgi:hypothetical protein
MCRALIWPFLAPTPPDAIEDFDKWERLARVIRWHEARGGAPAGSAQNGKTQVFPEIRLVSRMG